MNWKKELLNYTKNKKLLLKLSYMGKSIEYELLIKTNSYAGNFEREMCAFLVGSIGDCEVGAELVENEIANRFADLTISKPDDHGCSRPVDVDWSKRNGEIFTNFIIFFSQKLSKKDLEFIDNRGKLFQDFYRKKEFGDKKFEYLGLEQYKVETSIKKVKI